MSLPAFIINLDRRQDRWRLISENIRKIGLEATRIAAIDVLSLESDQLSKVRAGPVACALSHYKAMAAFLQCDAPAALILEDDAEVGTSVPSIIRSIDWWPQGHGLIKLESKFNERRRVWLDGSVGLTPDGRSLRPVAYKNVSAWGYLIDRKTAEQVLAISPNVPMPIDVLLFHLADSKIARGARPLQLVPGAVRHRALKHVGSDVGRIKSPRMGYTPSQFVRLNRLIRKCALFTGRAQRVHVVFEN